MPTQANAFVAPQPIQAPVHSHALDAADASWRSASEAERANSSVCVDHYYHTAAVTWPCLGPQFPDADRQHAWQLYHASLAKLVETGQRFHRLEPDRGLKVNTAQGAGYVAIEYGGFPWQPDDFNRLEPASLTNQDPKIDRVIQQNGLGVPFVAIRQRPESSDFLPSRTAFAATAVLEPNAGGVSSNDVVRTMYSSPDQSVPTIATLRLVDPTRIDQLVIDGQSVPIASNLSTAISDSLSKTDDSPIERLMRPDSLNEFDGLQMLEPYQPGKIPIIFVHGLISDRSTWANMTNELRAVPWIQARYQFWYFQYPTGEPFLRSAMTLREQVYAAVEQLDPQGQDAALSQMVLIGHSMGGLVSKLQATWSSTTIWDAYANRPFPQIQGPPQGLDLVSRLFFFEPAPFVKRVVFIGTPHQGAALASRSVGRLAANMVQEPPDRKQMHRMLIAANPGVFRADFQQRIPSSVDLLEPDSPLLAAMMRLSLASDVRIHSIVGMRQGGFGAASDGVVPVTSARHPGATSEYFINASHGQLTRHKETITEVSRILAEHLYEAAPR
ncbi:MAG: alpha/beta fold hydrolase [Planctomycetaceae bacterium]|nr:alpha/beta fold hydrolase [Planctomycetales bacterium]MCB9875455.1 alpha/beta fold hydrolase [Planctomycetaceae bacterium]MCB9938031.1 alpha/beta fold hydrolase [Planctomycetaceae bacterium]